MVDERIARALAKEHCIICMPGPITEDSVTGSILTTCEGCGLRVTLAPSGQKLFSELGEDKLAILCPTCGVAAIHADPAPQFAGITDDQIDELGDYLKERRL